MVVGLAVSVDREEGVMEQETWKRQAGSRDRAEVTFRSGCRCRGQVQLCLVLSAQCTAITRIGHLELVSSRFAGPVEAKSGALSSLERKGESNQGSQATRLHGFG